MKLTLMRPIRVGHDVSITFGVEGKQRAEFKDLLLDYIKFVEENGGGVHKIEEALDAETHETCDLTVFLHGMNQMMFIQEFQKRGEAFIDASAWQF